MMDKTAWEEASMDLCNPKELKELLSRHGFHFSKNMGAKFPHPALGPPADRRGLRRGPGVGVLEIGPGIGP